MELNNGNLGVLATRLNLPVDEITKAITEKDYKLELPELKTFTIDEFETFEANISKQKYDEAKKVYSEQSLRQFKQAIKEKYEIETDGLKSEVDIIEKLLSSKIEKVKSEFKGDSENTIKTLQELIQQKDNEFNLKIAEKEKAIRDYKTGFILDEQINLLNFDIPRDIQTLGDAAINDYISKERKKAKILFNSQFEIDFDEAGNVLTKKIGGDVIKDKIQNPEKLQNVVSEFAKMFNLNIAKTNTATGKVNTTKGNLNELTGLSLVEFDAMMAENKIQKGSNDYLTKYADWKKAQK